MRVGWLQWSDCENVRDLGGLPTVDGAATRHAALVRSDSPHRLTPDGVAAVWRHGVSRIVDLRSAAEAADLPGPFAGDPRYVLRPLIDPAAEALRDPASEPTLALVYQASIVRNAGHIVAGLAAVADAPAGAVVVHCASGKDRTGMLVALALRIAGVTDDAIAIDYAHTANSLAERHRIERAATRDERSLTRLRMLQNSNPDNVLSMLGALDARFGDVYGYLAAHGFTPQQSHRLRLRLRDG